MSQGVTKSLAWLTDIHLNFVSQEAAAQFISSLAESPVDAFLIGGDIGEAPDVGTYLRAFDQLARPVYFVLGNHDFYRGSIPEVRSRIESVCATCPNLHWLSKTGVVELTEQTGLVGHDGWGDGRLGDYWGSWVRLNDWRLIEDFVGLDAGARLHKLQALGDEAAAHLRALLPEALTRFRQIIVLTHVPPFREACWHEGRASSDPWLPHFTCKAVGDVLAEMMAASPAQSMMVLCGHAHSSGEAQILPNLQVLTGGAVYGKPTVQRVLEFA